MEKRYKIWGWNPGRSLHDKLEGESMNQQICFDIKCSWIVNTKYINIVVMLSFDNEGLGGYKPSATDAMLYKLSHTVFLKACFYSEIYVKIGQFFRGKKDTNEEFVL